MYIKWATLFFIIFKIVECTINQASVYIPMININIAQSTSFTTSKTHFASIVTNGLNHKTHVYEVLNTTSYTSIKKSYSTTFDNNFNIKVNSESSAYLVFNSTYLRRFTYNFSQFLSIYTADIGVEIVDCFFYENETQNIKYSLILEKNINNYFLVFMEDNLILTRITLDTSLNSTYTKAVVNFTSIYILFNSGIQQYKIQTSSLTSGWFFQFPQYQNITSLGISSYFIAYSYNNSLFVKNKNNNYNTCYSYVDSQQINDIQFMYPYLNIASSSQIKQLDIQIKYFISNYTFNSTNMRIGKILNFYLAFYNQKPRNSSVIFIFLVTGSYMPTVLGDCYDSYYQMGAYCFKNYTYEFNTIIIQKQQILSIIQKKKQHSALQRFSQISGKFFTFTSIKINPNFILSFLLVLDDLYYYQFHRCNYTESALVFMQAFDIMNDLRLNPWFLDAFYLMSENVVAIQQNKRAVQMFSFDNNNPNSIYFLNSSQNVYKSSVILNIIVYFIVKIVVFLMKHLQKTIYILKQVYHFLQACTKWWSFFFMIIQSNLAFLSFSCAIQLLSNGYFTFFDKFNFIILCTFLLIVICHTLISYPLIYRYSDKRAASSILVRSYYSMESFYLESFCVLLRNFVRSFINGIFIQNYSNQILVLTSSDVLFIFVSCIFFRTYMHKMLFLVFICYQIVILGMDFFFLYHDRQFLWFTSQSYDNIIFYLVGSVFISAVLISLVIFVLSAQQLFQNFKTTLRCAKKTFFSNENKNQQNLKKTVFILNKDAIKDEKITHIPVQFNRDKSNTKFLKTQGSKKINLHTMKDQIGQKNRYLQNYLEQTMNFNRRNSVVTPRAVSKYQRASIIPRIKQTKQIQKLGYLMSIKQEERHK